MKVLSLLALWLLVAVAGYGEDRPTIHSLVGREFHIEDDSTGQELAFRKKGESLVAVWRILGSGRPVISEIEYPVEVRSAWQIRFEVELKDRSRANIKVGITSPTEISIYLNGVRIPTREHPPRQRF
jgi:hypothetical protein